MKLRWFRFIVILYWIFVIVIVGMFVLGLWMVDFIYYSDWYKMVLYWYKSVGLILFVIIVICLVMCVVILWLLLYGILLEKRLSCIGYGFLYILIIMLFVSGYLILMVDGRSIDVFNWFFVFVMGEFFEN